MLPTLPSDALFNDAVLHEIRLEINSRDWQTLKDNYLTNEYYPCDFRWNGQVVRNVGIRSRGQASRSATKPSLRVDFNRYTDRPDAARLEIGRPAQQRDRFFEPP